MKKWSVIFTVVCAFLALAFITASGEKAKDGQDKPDAAGAIRAQYAPDRVLVKFKDDPNGMMAEAGRQQAEYLHNLKSLRRFSRIGVHVYQTTGSVEAALKALRQNPNIAYAEPDYVVTADVTIPNDASFSNLWGMNNTGQTGGTVDADIDAPEAWDLTTGSNNVIVAVIDTGVAYAHPDLAANMWVNPGEGAVADGIDNDSNGYIDDIYGINSITGSGDPMDDNNHGSHCAGTIAGVGNNGIGVAGVCWTAKIMALKFLDASGSGYDSDAIECIQYAINKGAHILSNSWGGSGFNTAMQEAIEDAASAGLLFVAAAGNYLYNNDEVPHYPSTYPCPNIIAVAATDHNDALAVWTPGSTGSHWGPYSVDVAAPGSNIYSTIADDTYGTMSGTSMATPHVAGLAALIKSYNFALNWMQIRDRILNSAEPKASLAGKILTGARVNAHDALLAGDTTSYRLDIQSAPAVGAAITVSPADLDGYSSGTTNFTRRYTPNSTVTLTASEWQGAMHFAYWELEGSHYSNELSISLPVDFNHTIVANYVLMLPEAVDNTAMSLVTFGIQGGWMGQVGMSHTGGDSAQSRDIYDNQSGTLQTSLRGPGTLTFYWKVSSESEYDPLSFSVDGTAQNSISGEADWQQVSYPVADGLHVIQWTYSKNASVSSGSDCGWVDDVQFSGSPATLAQALDQQSLMVATGEYGGWFPQATDAQYDGDAVQSSDIRDGERTALSATVEGPTSLSFYWKVSSELSYDGIIFYIDGVSQTSISGLSGWVQRTFSLTAGSHVLTWLYVKDSSVTSGSDCGWVDHIECSPAGTFALSLTQGGTGFGRVKVGSDPGPHVLPYSESFASGGDVSVEGVPDAGSAFTSWSGDLVSAVNPAVVTMNGNKSVTTNFTWTLPPVITVTSPNGGENWAMGSNHAVTWTQIGLTGDITIDLNKGGSYLKTLGTAAATAGTFSWVIAPDEEAGTDYRIIVEQGTASDSSDADFGLAPAPLLAEYFSDSTIPAGWTQQHEGTPYDWNLSLTNYAGGALNEMRRRYNSGGTLSRLITPPIDTTGYSSMNLSFRHFLDTWSTGGLVLKIQTSPNGTDGWTDEAWTVTTGSSDIGPATVQTILTNNVNITTTYVAFVIVGDLYDMLYWYIDDVEISGIVAPTSELRVDFNKDGQEDILWRYYGTGGRNRAWYLGGSGITGLSSITAEAAMERGLLDESVEPGRSPRPLADVDKGMAARPKAGSAGGMRDGMDRGFWSRIRRASGGAGGASGTQVEMDARPLKAGVIDPGAVEGGVTGERAVAGTEKASILTTLLGGADILAVPDLNWQIMGTGDFNNDGNVDVLWRYNGTGGRVRVWYMNGTSLISGADLTAVTDLNWRIAGTGDFNNDGNADILWRYNGAGGRVRVWYMNGINIVSGADLNAIPDLNWQVGGTGDFNNDGNVDILWRYYGAGGRNRIWYMNGAGGIISGADILAVSDVNWQIGGVADYSGDGNVDIIWRYNGTGGYVYIWRMIDRAWQGTDKLTAVPDLNWRIVNR